MNPYLVRPTNSEFPHPSQGVTSLQTNFLIQRTPGVYTSAYSYRADIESAGLPLCSKRYLMGMDRLVEGIVQVKIEDGSGQLVTNVTIPLKDDHILAAQDGETFKLSITEADFLGASSTLRTQGMPTVCRVTITFMRYRFRLQSLLLGQSYGPKFRAIINWACQYDSRTDTLTLCSPEYIASIVTHEMAHTLGLVPGPQVRRDNRPVNSKLDKGMHWFSEHGYVGDHCAAGLTATAKQATDYSAPAIAGTAVCLMFGGMIPGATFCSDCQNSLLKTDCDIKIEL